MITVKLGRMHQSVLLAIALLFLNKSNGNYCDQPTFNNHVVKSFPGYEAEYSFNLTGCANVTTYPVVTGFIFECVSQNLPVIYADAITDLERITEAFFWGNKLRTIYPNAFRNLTSLVKVNFEQNDLEEIQSDVFSTLPSLQDIKLKTNRISYIAPNAFRNLENLTYLNLAFNELEAIDPSWFRDTRSLRRIYLNSNWLTYVPARVFSVIADLHGLDLSDNLLLSLHKNAFVGVKSIEILDLSNNSLSELHRDLFAPVSGLLGQLTISDKYSKMSLESTVALRSGISDLYLNNNKFTYLPRKMMSDLKKVHRLNIHSNPWTCGCYNNIRDWINQQGISVNSNNYGCYSINGINPECVYSLVNDNSCVERIDSEAVEFYFKNLRERDQTRHDPDWICDFGNYLEQF